MNWILEKANFFQSDRHETKVSSELVKEIIRIFKVFTLWFVSLRVFVDQQNKYSDESNPERFETTSI